MKRNLKRNFIFALLCATFGLTISACGTDGKSSEVSSSEPPASSETSISESSSDSSSESSSSSSSEEEPPTPPTPTKTIVDLVKELDPEKDFEDAPKYILEGSNTQTKSIIKKAVVPTFDTDRLGGKCEYIGDNPSGYYKWSDFGDYQTQISSYLEEAFHYFGGRAVDYITFFKDFLPGDASFNKIITIEKSMSIQGSPIMDLTIRYYLSGTIDNYNLYINVLVDGMPADQALRSVMNVKKDTDGKYIYVARTYQHYTYNGSIDTDVIYVVGWKPNEVYYKYTLYDIPATSYISSDQIDLFKAEKREGNLWAIYNHNSNGKESFLCQTNTNWYLADRLYRDSNGEILDQCDQITISSNEGDDIISGNFDEAKQSIYLNAFTGYTLRQEDEEKVELKSGGDIRRDTTIVDTGNYYSGPAEVWLDGATSALTGVNVNVKGAISYNVRVKDYDYEEWTNRAIYLGEIVLEESFDNILSYVTTTLQMSNKCKYGDFAEIMDDAYSFRNHLKENLLHINLFGLTGTSTLEDFADINVLLVANYSPVDEFQEIFA